MMRALLSSTILVAAIMGCESSQAGGATDAQPTAKPAVIFHTEVGEMQVAVEVADTPAGRAKGLMYRDSMPADAGMVFIFPKDDDHVFWMKNTHIPLDMIFVTRGLTVAGVVANAEPLTETSRMVGAASRYVIEVNGGWAAAHGVVAGTPVVFRDVPETVAR